jgi:hypothetical protein
MKESSKKSIEFRPAQPYRNPSAGRLFQIEGYIIGFVGLLFIIGDQKQDSMELLLYGFGALIGGYYIWFQGRRIASVSAEQLLLQDKRAPVLFIRSFEDEEKSYSLSTFYNLIKTVFVDLKFLKRYFQAGASFWGPVLQLQFNGLFSKIGPFIAIGRPGEKIPAMGAARLYVSDNDWKNVISDFLSRARLIVVLPGTTPGLRWEINEMKRAIAPQKILFILPEKEGDYASFCSWVNKELPVKMPEVIPGGRFIALDDQWKPYEMGGYSMLLDTLEPYLKRNGIRKSDFSLTYRLINNSWLSAIIITLFLFVLLFGVAGILFP